jgi:beta-glucanase (GH16 family)
MPLWDIPSGWRLILDEDFDGAAVDPQRWDTLYPNAKDEGCTIASNEELEWYQRDDVLVENSLLRLRAQRRSVNGFAYTSGCVSSHDRFYYQYGYLEMRARVPAGRGLWPALWMMPQTRVYPPEIDILELLGHDTHTAYMTYHYGPYEQLRSIGEKFKGPDFAADFHRFGLLWQPRLLVWTIDGVERHRLESEHVADMPMYLRINLAVGGKWPGAPDAATRFPAYYEIDWIRVWQE